MAVPHDARQLRACLAFGIRRVAPGPSRLSRMPERRDALSALQRGAGQGQPRSSRRPGRRRGLYRAPLHYADLLKQMKLGACAVRCRPTALDLAGSSNTACDRSPLRRFAGGACSAATPPRLDHQAVREARSAWPIGFIVHDSLARRWQSRAQEEIFRDLTHGWVLHCFETLSRVLAEHGLEYRSPLLRLNVVEFGLAIPEEQRWRGAETKFVLRQSMKGLLPEKIRIRKDKADFGALFPRTLSKLDSASVFQSLRLVVDGLARQRVTSAGCTRGSPRGNRTRRSAALAVWPLWMIFGVECWLRRSATVERSRAGEPAPHARGIKDDATDRHALTPESHRKAPPYRSPTLTAYGSVAKLTQGGSGSDSRRRQ